MLPIPVVTTRLVTNGPAVYTTTDPSPTTTNLVFDHFLPNSLSNFTWTNMLAHTNGRDTQVWSERTHPAGWPAVPPVVKWNTNSLIWGMKGMTGLTGLYLDNTNVTHAGVAELREALVKVAFYAVTATLMVAPLALGDRGLYAKFLASRPMVFLGEISYEIFLIHLLTMELVMVEIVHYPIYTGSIVVVFVVSFVVTVPVAWLLHRFTRVRSG